MASTKKKWKCKSSSTNVIYQLCILYIYMLYCLFIFEWVGYTRAERFQIFEKKSAKSNEMYSDICCRTDRRSVTNWWVFVSLGLFNFDFIHGAMAAAAAAAIANVRKQNEEKPKTRRRTSRTRWTCFRYKWCTIDFELMSVHIEWTASCWSSFCTRMSTGCCFYKNGDLVGTYYFICFGWVSFWRPRTQIRGCLSRSGLYREVIMRQFLAMITDRK